MRLVNYWLRKRQKEKKHCGNTIAAKWTYGVNPNQIRGNRRKKRLPAAAMNEKDRRLSIRIAFCLEEGVIG